MAKKIKKNDNELVQVALDSHKWINTPVVYTKFGSNFNRFQQDVMLLVSGQLQDHIKKYLDDGRYLDPNTPKPIFTADELQTGIAPFRINLVDLGVGDGHYEDVSDALESIKNLWVKKPVFDQNTGIRKGDDWLPIFEKVFVPQSRLSAEGDEYKYEQKSAKYDASGNLLEYVPSRRDGYIEVTINTQVAAYAFDMSRGYFNHLERIAYFCNSSHTSRLYLLLMASASRGSMTPVVNYMELKDHLGMIEREPKSDVIKSVKYEKFSQFKKQVLDVAQKDMDRLALENKTEIVFTYEPVYRGFAKRGDPSAIKFFIRKTMLGSARDMKLHRGSNEDRLMTRLMALCPELNQRVLTSVFADVPDGVWTKFYKFATTEIEDIVNNKQPADRSAYIITVLRNWVDENGTKASEGPEEVMQQEPSLFADDAFDDADTPQLMPGNRVGEWEKLVAEYGEGASSELLASAKCLGTIDDAFALQMPDLDATERMTRATVDDARLKALLVRYVGRPFKTIQVSCR